MRTVRTAFGSLLTLVAFTALAVVLSACGGDDGDGAEETGETGSFWITSSDNDVVYKVDPADGTVEETITVGGSPTDIAVGHDAVWVANADDGTVSRIDPDEGTVAATIDTRDARGVLVTDEEVWISRIDDPPSLVAIDPATNQTGEEIVVGKENLEPEALAYLDGKIFAEESYAGGILSFDLDTGTVDSVRTGDVITSVIADEESIFAASESAVLEVDPLTLSVKEHTIDERPWAIAKDETEDALWVASQLGTVRKLDLASGRYSSTIAELETDDQPYDMTVADGAVWVIDEGGGLSKIDPETTTVEETYELPETRGASIAFG